MMYSKIEEDVKQLKKMYGSNLDIKVAEDYYVCYFTNSVGAFKFQVLAEKLHNPFALSYNGEDISEAIEKLQEL